MILTVKSRSNFGKRLILANFYVFHLYGSDCIVNLMSFKWSSQEFLHMEAKFTTGLELHCNQDYIFSEYFCLKYLTSI